MYSFVGNRAHKNARLSLDATSAKVRNFKLKLTYRYDAYEPLDPSGASSAQIDWGACICGIPVRWLDRLVNLSSMSWARCPCGASYGARKPVRYQRDGAWGRRLRWRVSSRGRGPIRSRHNASTRSSRTVALSLGGPSTVVSPKCSRSLWQYRYPTSIAMRPAIKRPCPDQLARARRSPCAATLCWRPPGNACRKPG